MFLAGAVALALAAPVRASEAEPVRCVAALKLHSNDLAQQVKAGDAARRPELLQVLREGAAFIGQAYLQHGLGEEDDAKAELAQAEAGVRALPPAQAVALRSQCSVRAEALIKGAAGWQRMVIDRFAQARMDKLLQQPPPQ
jgi:hypothetical protein